MTMHEVAQREKNWVAMTSLLAAVGITAFKIIIGVGTNSLGILAEAAHSGLDLVAAGMTCVAIRSAVKPPDSEHRFGHGKVENLSALFETLLLIFTCGWIFYGALSRLLYEEAEVLVTYWSFLVMATSIVVDYHRSRALRRAAKKYNSQALEADALHFETDIWSSAAVIIGLVCVVIGSRKPEWEFLVHGDAVAALAVAVIAAVITIRLGVRTINALIDRAPVGMDEQIKNAALSVSGILDCHQIRVRTSGPQVFADVHVIIDGGKTLAEAHNLTEEVEEAVGVLIPDADVTVHAEPGVTATNAIIPPTKTG